MNTLVSVLLVAFSVILGIALRVVVIGLLALPIAAPLWWVYNTLIVPELQTQPRGFKAFWGLLVIIGAVVSSFSTKSA